MSAEMYSILAALFISLHVVLSRKGLTKVNPFAGTFITIVVAVPILTSVCLVNGDFHSISLVAPEFVTFLALGGVLHFTVGRTLFYHSNRIVGAPRAGTLASTKLIYVTIFGSILLQESIGGNFVVGVVLVFAGSSLILFSAVSPKNSHKRQKRSIRGFVFGLLSGVIWGVTPLLIRVGTVGVESPLLSSLISYVFAAISYPMLLIGSGHGQSLRSVGRSGLCYFLLAGISVCAGQVFRYSALFLASAGYVTLIMNIEPLFTVLLSYLFIRRIENMNMKMVSGTLLTLSGIYALIGM